MQVEVDRRENRGEQPSASSDEGPAFTVDNCNSALAEMEKLAKTLEWEVRARGERVVCVRACVL